MSNTASAGSETGNQAVAAEQEVVPGGAQSSAAAAAARPGIEALAALTQAFKDERPKLANAIKNYLAYIGATRRAAGGEPVAHSTVHELAMGRYVLNGLNDPNLLPAPSEWGAKHPQKPDQLGIDRLEQLTKYKVAFLLGNQVALKGAKRTHFFGTSAVLLKFDRCWPSARRAHRDHEP